MRFADFPFLRYLPFLISGVILSQRGGELPILYLGMMLIFCWGLYSYVVLKRSKSNSLPAALLGYGLLFILGVFFSERQKAAGALSYDTNLEYCDSYLAKVEKYDITKPNSMENLLSVIQVKDSLGWHDSVGKVLIYHKNERPLLPGEIIWVQKSPERIPPPQFPDEFDYSAYLSRKDIHFRQFIGSNFSVVDTTLQGSAAYWLEKTRKSLVEIIEDKIDDRSSQQIAAALLLGQKDNLDREIRNAYAETGTMHILAVSGLHVGIIYAILLFPLKGIRLSRRGKKVYLIVVVFIIWGYAILTGFSPSVVRAATIFSLLTLGQLRERRPSSWNLLAFSAMIMVVIDPGVIFDVGFQLSYLAVGGILLLQPLILRWWLPPHKVLEYIWQITAVSIAAQLATFPLSILYFHIFPSYFLVANLVIIPLSFVVMNVGILMLALSWVPSLGDWLGVGVDYLIRFQNWLTLTIQQLPGGNLERLTISASGMLLVWGLLTIWAHWEMGDRKKLIYFGLLLFLAWSVQSLVKELQRPPAEVLIFHGEKGVLLDFRVGDRVYSWNESFPPEQISYSIDPNRLADHRPRIPESGQSFGEGGMRWFPLFDFRFDAVGKNVYWGAERPQSAALILPKASEKMLLDDSLVVNKGAFRIVF